MKRPSLYFKWLQIDNPTGGVDRFPDLRDKYETSVPGLYCIGDLTGIPLIKLASESGFELIEKLNGDERFRKERENRSDETILDLIIVGAGPSGVSACLRAAELGMRHLLIESSKMFSTLVNFPAGKPIYVTPAAPPMKSALKFSDGSKESLLQELEKDIEGKPLPLREGEMVRQITRRQDYFEVETTADTYKALRVIVAIGKTGNARRIGVPGEDLPKVYTRLIDPTAFSGANILVAGGGDSAIEAAVALSRAGNCVTLSYRKPALQRPGEQNLLDFNKQVKAGTLTPVFSSGVKEIRERDVVLTTVNGEQVIPNDAVFVLIGSELPLQFFKRSGIRMEREKDTAWRVFLITMVSFFSMLYFGKSGFAAGLFAGTEGLAEGVLAWLAAPFVHPGAWALKGSAWYPSLNFILGWLGSLVFLASAPAALFFMVKRRGKYFGTAWDRTKYSYLVLCALLYTYVHFTSLYGQNAGWAEGPTFWYSLLYTTTIILFGLRRMQTRPTAYIRLQTLTLMGIQIFFLFLLPFFLYDAWIAPNFARDGWFISEVFPRGKWSSFGLILFWPLNMGNFGTSTFWTWFPFVQTFVLLPLIVYKWGKGAYCGWICSCGAMAETLGDEYRHLAPHGPRAKKLENIGQIVLWFAFAAAVLHFFSKPLLSGTAADTVWGLYKLSIDVVFAGVLGLGVYFFLGGRVWCRYGCPLAALMHIYTRFSPYRIMADKKRCISCGICTKVCHMGIDVMGYASRGVPMNDVECVRCSACIVNCPLEVLTFGSTGKPDPDNVEYRGRAIPFRTGWTSGL